ncbi:MAG: hypothetical protein OEV22_16135, partial [Deltaproteobacteria bacterium]|nr:hypothetical protein [Deltaproteobacteria bacterium]
MSKRKQKSDIPEAVIDYCIDNKLSMTEGLVAMIEEKFESLDSNIKSLKRDVTKNLYNFDSDDDSGVSDSDIRDVENFLDFLD